VIFLLKVCVVVPTYNERENISPLVESVKSVGVEGLQLLFVDDSSPDGTSEEVARVASKEDWVRLLRRDRKKGIGSAYLDGFREAISSVSPDVLIEMDGDMQHPPSKIPELLSELERGADAAVASRYVPGGGVSGWGFWRSIVSRGANWYARKVLGLKVRDCTSGFRAYTRRAAESLLDSTLPTSGFAFQVAALFQLKRQGMSVSETPFVFELRRAGRSKLSLAEGVEFFIAVLRLRFGLF
jgi:dolichol-phosphate mannosyltransferase